MISLFHRGRHRAGRFSRTVADIQTELATELPQCNQPWRKSGWHLSPDGKFYCMHARVYLPDEWRSSRVMFKPPETLTSIPALVWPDVSA